MKLHLTFIAVCTLAACQPNDEPIQGTRDSLVNTIQVGMTPEEVEARIGAFQFEVSEGGLMCRSYIYDETLSVKFAHVLFEDGKVIEAQDGAQQICRI